MDDAALVAGCRAGDPTAWASLVSRYRRLIWTVPRRAGLSDALAADVFQFTFARLFEQLHRLEDPSRVRAWLVTTARRETLRLLGQRVELSLDLAVGKDGRPLVDRMADPAPLPEHQLAELQELDRLRRAVDGLDESSRRFVELHFLQDPPLSYAEQARRLGIAEGSIGPTRARCLAKLRRGLGEARPAAESPPVARPGAVSPGGPPAL